MIKYLSVAVAFSMVGSVALADTTINGFASVKAGMTTGSNDRLYGYDDSFDLRNESLFAIQLRSDLGENLSVTGQLMGRGSDDFDVNFEWAFLTYTFNEETSVSAGRLRTPFFKYSDFRDVGYAYDWLRTPQSVYSLGFDNIEGVTLYRTGQIGTMDSSLQFIYGDYDSDALFSGAEVEAQIDAITGLTWELSQGSLSARAAYLVADVTFQIDPIALAPGFTIGNLFSTLNQAGASALIAALNLQQDSGSFLGLSLTYDDSDWIAVAEITRTEVENSFLPVLDSYYISVGKRFNSFTPFVSYEKDLNKALTGIYAPYQAILPPQLFVPVKSLVDSQGSETATWNVGMRYDFHPSAAFKAQFTEQDNQLTGNRQSLISVGIDLVF